MEKNISERPSEAAGTEQYVMSNIAEREVYYYINDSPMVNCAFGMAMRDAMNAKDPLIAAGCVMGILKQFWVKLGDVIDEACRSKSISLLPVRVPSQAKHFLLNAADVKRFTRQEMLVYNAYFILLLFKTIDRVTYTASFEKRISELKRIAGVHRQVEIFVVFDADMADQVSTIIGANRKLCRSMMDALSDETKRDKEMGPVAAYLLDAISPTDTDDD